VSTQPNGSSNYLLRNVNSGKCRRAAPTGTAVTQQTCDSTSLQMVWHQHLREAAAGRTRTTGHRIGAVGRL
jgi:hypothetical protein